MSIICAFGSIVFFLFKFPIREILCHQKRKISIRKSFCLNTSMRWGVFSWINLKLQFRQTFLELQNVFFEANGHVFLHQSHYRRLSKCRKTLLGNNFSFVPSNTKLRTQIRKKRYCYRFFLRTIINLLQKHNLHFLHQDVNVHIFSDNSRKKYSLLYFECAVRENATDNDFSRKSKSNFCRTTDCIFSFMVSFTSLLIF